VTRTPLVLLVLLAVLAGLAPAARAQRKPVTAKDQLRFGVDMAQQGLWSEALFRFKQAERLTDGEHAAIANNIAVALEALGQFDEALDYYRRALRIEPNNQGLKRNYARFAEFYQSYKPEGEEPASDEAEPPAAAPPGAAGSSSDAGES
jgi:tetratricopeptide (TPR) repeat protein